MKRAEGYARIALALLVMVPLALLGGGLHWASRGFIWAAKHLERAFDAVRLWAEDGADY